MSADRMNSMQRVLTTLSHKEADRVPFFLLLSLHGARELKLSIRDYFADAENVFEGQLRLREKYHHDCLYTFYYAPIEIEAWGGEVIFWEDGPPNSGRPFIQSVSDIERLAVPAIADIPGLNRVLSTTEMLKKEVGDEVPIIGVAISPFSLPVMQMGFDKYIELLYDHERLFRRLMDINMEFCINWANAQLAAGATAICYFDPLASPTIIPKELYRKTGFEIAKATISRIQGPTATHLASGVSLAIADELVATGTAVVGVSVEENLTELKSVFQNRLTILGNLNGIEMRHWTRAEAEEKVKTAILEAAGGGGFILSDNHGEIPWQVSDEVLQSISEAVFKYGYYPVGGY